MRDMEYYLRIQIVDNKKVPTEVIRFQYNQSILKKKITLIKPNKEYYFERLDMKPGLDRKFEPLTCFPHLPSPKNHILLIISTPRLQVIHQIRNFNEKEEIPLKPINR